MIPFNSSNFFWLQHQGITTTIARLEFHAPFKPFIQRWEKLIEALNTHEGETKTHLELLHKVLKKNVWEIIDAKKDFLANKV